MPDEPRLTVKQAFDAMIEFMDQFQRETNSEDMAQFVFEIGYQSYDPNGAPVTNEPGAWAVWTAAVERVLTTRTG